MVKTIGNYIKRIVVMTTEDGDIEGAYYKYQTSLIF